MRKTQVQGKDSIPGLAFFSSIAACMRGFRVYKGRHFGNTETY
jgi:hypothetical protein